MVQLFMKWKYEEVCGSLLHKDLLWLYIVSTWRVIEIQILEGSN